MSIDKDQFRQLITEVLQDTELYSEDAVELLMMTAAQESHLGTYLWQLGGGPARGFFQMERATEEDILDNYIIYRPELVNVLSYYTTEEEERDMVYSLPYQILMARIHYKRVPEKLPSKDNVMAMAEYYKRYFNTYKGKATVEEAVENYQRLCL